MKITLNETGRKPLAALLSEYTSTGSQYLRTPSYTYQIGGLPLTREGNVEGPGIVSQAEYGELLALLDANGYCRRETDFHPAQGPGVEAISTDETGLTITIPLEDVSVGNFTSLLGAKGSLIKHALHVNDLHFELSENNISFPWFSELPAPDRIRACNTLIAALCKVSKDQKRTSVIERPIDSERYAFRCFLLRLGFIGGEYKIDHKVLMRYLPGNSVFGGGEGHAISE